MEVALLVSIPIIYVGIGLYAERQESSREARFKKMLDQGQHRYSEIDSAIRRQHAADREEDRQLVVEILATAKTAVREYVREEVKQAIKDLRESITHT